MVRDLGAQRAENSSLFMVTLEASRGRAQWHEKGVEGLVSEEEGCPRQLPSWEQSHWTLSKTCPFPERLQVFV